MGISVYIYSFCHRSMDDRYKGMCDVAKTRSIVSLGISCFKSKTEDNTGNSAKGEAGNHTNSSITSYDVQTFNIFVLCSENYIVEPLSLIFLVEHGFDFNRQYEKGLSYHRGNDKASSSFMYHTSHSCTLYIDFTL